MSIGRKPSNVNKPLAEPTSALTLTTLEIASEYVELPKQVTVVPEDHELVRQIAKLKLAVAV